MISPGLNHPGLGSPSDRAAREALDGLRRATGARLLMVVDRSGAVVLSSGDLSGLDGPGFASQSAAHFDRNRHLATLVGESDFRSLLHQGDRTSVYFAEIADAAVLAVLYDGAPSASLLGQEWAEIVSGLESPIRSMLARRQLFEGGSTLLGPSWVAEAEMEIDRVFREGA